jgi:hypothetical protein
MMKFFRRTTAAMAFLAAVFVAAFQHRRNRCAWMRCLPQHTRHMATTRYRSISHRDVQWLLRFWYIYVSREKTPEGRPAYVTTTYSIGTLTPWLTGGPGGTGPVSSFCFSPTGIEGVLCVND